MSVKDGASVHDAEAARPSPVDAEATGTDTHAADDECVEGYAGPSAEAPPKTARVDKRAGGGCPAAAESTRLTIFACSMPRIR